MTENKNIAREAVRSINEFESMVSSINDILTRSENMKQKLVAYITELEKENKELKEANEPSKAKEEKKK